MYWSGILIGLLTFLIIGLFHPIVIKCEYYFTWRVWPVFLVGGLLCSLASLFVARPVASGALAVLGFAMLWSIHELKEQAQRVARGWFPANPQHGGAVDLDQARKAGEA